MVFFFFLDPIVIDKLTLNHFRKLRDYPLYRDAHIFVYVESNMSFVQSKRVADMLKQHPEFGAVEVLSYDKDPQNRFGVVTTPQNKEEYATHLTQLLRDGLFRYAEHIVGENPVKTIADFENQLKNYRKEQKKPADQTFQKFQWAYSGKSDGNKDDLSMVAQIVCYWANWKRMEANYGAQAAQYGWRD